MNKRQFIATFWLILLFGSGLLAGLALSPTNAHGVSTMKELSGKGMLPEQRWVMHHRELLLSELDLSEEQLALVEPVYEQTSERLREVRETMLGNIKEVVRENRRGLMDVLTPEQIKRFAAIQAGDREDR